MDLAIFNGKDYLSLVAVAEGCCGYSIVYFHFWDRPDAVIAFEQGALSLGKKVNLASACAFLAASGITDDEMRVAILRQGCTPVDGSLASSFAKNASAIHYAVRSSNWFAELEDVAQEIALASI